MSATGIEIPIVSTYKDKGAKAASKSLNTLTKSAKALGLAFGVFQTINFSKKAVRAFADDERAAGALSKTLQNLGQSYAVLQTAGFIQNLQNTTGILDDQLRPAFTQLVNSTLDAKEAQKLLSVALDVSAGTGKDLQSVTVALSKAVLKENTALSRLGIGLSKAELATMDMALFYTVTFEAFVQGFQGGDGLKNAFDDIIEVAKTILIPILDGLRSIFNRVKTAVMDNKEAFSALWTFAKEYLAPFLGGAFRVALEVVGVAIGAVVTAVGLLIKAFQTLFEWGNKVKDFLTFGGGGSNASRSSFEMPGFNAAPFVASPGGGYSGQAVNYNNNITVNGAIDSESTARQIVDVLNQSSYRGTLGAGAFV